MRPFNSLALKRFHPLACVLILLFTIVGYYDGFGQTVRYQNSIKGGFALAGNSLGLRANTFANTAGGTTMSSTSDLVLPAGSTIVKAILYVEAYAKGTLGGTMKQITGIKFKVGAGAFVPLTPTSPGFLANPLSTSKEYGQFIIDVTSLVPAQGYITTVTPGGSALTTGRYAVGDVTPTVTDNQGYGWALFIVYTNPVSQYRNITIADACLTSQGASLIIPNVIVPSFGTVKAVIGVTGSYGDIGLLDYCGIGIQGGPVPVLKDPTTGLTSDILNSTVGFALANNVTADGGATIDGDFKGRNPYNTFDKPLLSGTWYSYWYDADIIDATGSLPNSPTPINVNLIQVSAGSAGGSEFIGYGAYGVSIDIVAAKLTKALAPKQIYSGERATYTFTIDNTSSGAINLSNIGFTDNIPAGLMIANPNNVVITGGTGGTVVAVPGTNVFTLSGFNLNGGATATITLNVTNKPGELNPTCDANPAKFTNSFNNITGNTANMGNGVTPQCLIVLATPPPVFTADTVCQGFATNFTDTTRVTAPLSISKWEWFFGDNSVSSAQNPTHTYANPGIYTVKMKLTFSNGVVDSISKQVKVNPLPQLTLGAAPTICRGDTASLTVTGTGTISWTPAASLSSSTVFNPRAFPAATTTYQIKVTDPTTLCFKDTSITVTVNPRPVPVITGDLTVCPGGLPTVLTATGGVSYRWLPGNETTASITVSPQTQTSYSVIATNANGCKDTATVTVTMVAPPSRFVAAVTNRSCGSVNGSITVTSVTGGKAPYQYSRNGGTFQTANTFTGLDTTNYLITVKDAKGCTYDSILRVGITSGPTATAFTTAGSGCGNPTGRITVNSSTGGKAPYQYSIDGSTYQAGNMFTSLGSGSYQLYVKDANGCIYDTSAVVGALSGPSDLAVSVTADSCNKHNGTVTITGVTGGNPPYQYSQDGTTYGAANSFGSLTGGAFTVYVRDAANCVFSKGGTVPTIIPVSAFQSFSTVDSCELGKGTISVRDEVDGRTPYQYSINGGTFQASNTFTGLAHGNYTLTVKDAGGCTVSQPDTVVPTAPIQGINPATTAATCSQSNGSVSITVTGGTGPFLLQLNNLAPDTITTYNGLSIRTHTVTVVDSNLCTATQTFAITDIPGPSAVSFTQTPTSCTTPTGTFTITGVTGGTMPYTYSVDHSPYTTDTAYTGLDSITHTLSVKDSNGCIKDSSVTIVTVNRPTALQYTLTHTTCSQSNGAIAITGVTGGTIPYTYAIDNSAFTTTTNYPGLTAKVYAIAVTDVNNCRFQITDTIKDSPSPDDLELSGTFTSCGRSLGSITIGNISKGTAPFLFSVNNSPFTATKVYPGLAGGNYRVEVRDVNGCMYFEMITIDDIAGPSNLYLDHADDTCGRNSGTLVITHVDGPARPFTFSKDGTIFQSDTVFTQVAALARYTVTVKDNNGCVITATDSVGIVKGPNLPTDFGTKDPHCDLADGSLFIRISSITEGTPPITLSIGGQPQPTNGETFTGLVENNYTVVITDANGCTNTRNFMLTDIPAPHDATTTIAGSTCSLPNGSLTITSVDGGTPPYTYSHLSSGFDTATVFNGLSSGTNQLFVIRDSAGCLLDVRRDIPGAPGPTEITAGIVDENCFRGDGALTGLKATGGTKPVTFLFQSSSTYAEGQSVNNLRNGNYTIEATDANGCQLTDTFTIENRPAPVADFSASQYSGEAPANISFYNESTGAANYAWSFGNGETSTLAEPAYYYSDSGTYQVQLYAANAAGCADSITKTIMLAPMVSLYIPNSFTPDGDGINDFFTVKSYCIESYQLDVWNRWGEKIITISQDSPGWDGTFMGEECKTDSYPYRIVAVDYLGHKHHHLGKVTLMR